MRNRDEPLLAEPTEAWCCILPVRRRPGSGLGRRLLLLDERIQVCKGLHTESVIEFGVE